MQIDRNDNVGAVREPPRACPEHGEGAHHDAPLRRILIDYSPTPVQRQFHGCGARFRLLRAGRRAGKTFAAVNDFIRGACQRKGHYWIVGPNFPILRTAERIFRHFMPRQLIRSHSKSEKTYRLVNGSLIELRSADNPDSLVSVGLDGLLIDEAARVPRAAWEENLRATLADRRGWAIFATTPKGRANWVYDMHRDYPQIYNGDFAEFVFRTIDNTAVPGIAEEVELARRSLPERYFRQDFEGSFEAFTGAVYPEFDEAIHVAQIDWVGQGCALTMTGKDACPTKFSRVIAGVDWGYTHPAAIIVVGQTKIITEPSVGAHRDAPLQKSHLFVLDEFYEKGLLVEETGLVSRARALKERWGIELFVADPSEPAYIEKFRRSGLPCKPGDNDVGPGIQAVAMALHIRATGGPPVPQPGQAQGPAPTMIISSRCSNLIRELKLYHWRERKSDSQITEEPEKVDDHACDALRYAIMELARPKAISIGLDPEEAEFARGRRWR